MIRKTYTYRIAPTKAHQHLLDTMLEQCRWVYNEVLTTRKALWEHAQVLQNVCIRAGPRQSLHSGC